MADSLGDRMKRHERVTEVRLPRNTWTVVRLDGKAFHSYTKGLERPYDRQLMEDMAATAQYLARSVDGCVLAYTQSDEITLVLSDHGMRREPWFDGKLQKIVSVTASMASAMFNQLRPGLTLALFDSRAFPMADLEEVANCLVWRQQDATRNSVSMLAQSMYSHKKLQNVSGKVMQEMMWQDFNVNWNDEDPRFKRGQVAYRVISTSTVRYTHKVTKEVLTVPDVERREWSVAAAPVFTQHREWLLDVLRGEIPELPVG